MLAMSKCKIRTIWYAQLHFWGIRNTLKQWESFFRAVENEAQKIFVWMGIRKVHATYTYTKIPQDRKNSKATKATGDSCQKNIEDNLRRLYWPKKEQFRQ